MTNDLLSTSTMVEQIELISRLMNESNCCDIRDWQIAMSLISNIVTTKEASGNLSIPPYSQ